MSSLLNTPLPSFLFLLLLLVLQESILTLLLSSSPPKKEWRKRIIHSQVPSVSTAEKWFAKTKQVGKLDKVLLDDSLPLDIAFSFEPISSGTAPPCHS